jgi:hypothetical protein
VINSGGNVKVYDLVAYEDIDIAEDGTISFEFQGYSRRIRPIQDEDGSFIMDYRMPFSAEAMRAMITMDGKNNTLIDQSIDALVDPESGEVRGFVYDISNLGLFFRSDSKWGYPTPEMLEMLEESNSVPLTLDGAKQAVAKWDKGKGVSAEELKKYRSEEDE